MLNSPTRLNPEVKRSRTASVRSWMLVRRTLHPTLPPSCPRAKKKPCLFRLLRAHLRKLHLCWSGVADVGCSYHDVYNFMWECGLSRIELCLRKATVAAVAKKVVGDVDLADFDSLKIFVLGFFGRRRLHLSQSLAMFRLEVGFESFLAFSSVLMPIISGNATMSNALLVQSIASDYSSTEGHRKMPECQQQCSAVADSHVFFDCVSFSSR